MEKVDEIIQAKWMITCEEKKVLENHSLVIDKNLIKDILPIELAAQKYSATHIEHFATHVVLPGFINTHTHLAMNYFRGLADDLALMDWLNNYIWPAEKKWVSQEFVHDASLFAIAEMIRGGSICFNDMYFFLQQTAKAVDISGIRGAIGMTVINVPTAWAKNPDEYLAKGMEFFQEYKNHPRILTTIAPHGPYTVDDEHLLQIKKIAEDNNLKINMHVHETKDEIQHSLKNYQMRPLARLKKLGLVSPRLIAIHACQLNEEDIKILTDGKPQIVHCPESNMKLASGTCPVARLHSLGLNIALGTDGAASNNDLDMVGEMRSAAFLTKHTTENPATQPALDTIYMATINGAKALGLENITGSLKKGKSADFIAINLDDIETRPLYHADSQVVYAASRNQVSDVWVAGVRLLKKREFTTLDEEAIKTKARNWRNKIMS